MSKQSKIVHLKTLIILANTMSDSVREHPKKIQEQIRMKMDKFGICYFSDISKINSCLQYSGNYISVQTQSDHTPQMKKPQPLRHNLPD